MIAAIYDRLPLAMLGLLALATSASAECARVLWRQVASPNPTAGSLLVTVPLGGWNDRRECEQARLQREQTAPQPRTVIFVCPPRHGGPVWAEAEVSAPR
jgi:hypothetical protein